MELLELREMYRKREFSASEVARRSGKSVQSVHRALQENSNPGYFLVREMAAAVAEIMAERAHEAAEPGSGVAI